MYCWYDLKKKFHVNSSLEKAIFISSLIPNSGCASFILILFLQHIYYGLLIMLKKAFSWLLFLLCCIHGIKLCVFYYHINISTLWIDSFIVCDRACTFDYRPVCGSDGKTYGNQCSLDTAHCKSQGKIIKKSDGECPGLFCHLNSIYMKMKFQRD